MVLSSGAGSCTGFLRLVFLDIGIHFLYMKKNICTFVVGMSQPVRAACWLWCRQVGGVGRKEWQAGMR